MFLLRVYRQKVLSAWMSSKPFSRRKNYVPVRYLKNKTNGTFIDLAFWRNKMIVQVAYIVPMNAIVFVDAEKTVTDWEYSVLVNKTKKAAAAIDKLKSVGKEPDPQLIADMNAIYEVPDKVRMEEYIDVLFGVPVTGRIEAGYESRDFDNEYKSVQKKILGKRTNGVLMAMVTRIRKNHTNKYGEQRAGYISATVKHFEI
ncbi:MAG TPA: hypothetical protein PLV00_08495 [Caldisericia bacterium]|nr:hypothetical protein [Caldisericia bacterium]